MIELIIAMSEKDFDEITDSKPIINWDYILVRCRDCKYTKRDGTEEAAIYCEKWDRWEMPEDFYCAYGERADDEDGD